MAEELIPLKISIALVETKFINFETTTRLQEIKEPIPDGASEFQFNFKINVREELKSIEFLTTITLFEKQANNVKVELAILKANVAFKIFNFDEVLTKKEKGFQIKDQVMHLMLGISYSTLRGMFCVCSKDTIVSTLLIPIVDPKIFTPQSPVIGTEIK